MRGYEIKFKFNISLLNKEELDNIFKEIGKILSIKFNEQFEVYSEIDDEIYQFMEVSTQTIDEISDSFFKFTFNNIINVPLYQFLVLKNNNELTILANIHSSIFDYTSINTFYELFHNLTNTPIKKNISSHYTNLNNYLTSSEFEQVSEYWNETLINLENYVKYYNIKSKNYGKTKISLENEKLNDYLKRHKISKFNIITAIFSLYLSRINRTNGCLLKTIIPKNDELDKNTILKIDYNKNDSFKKYLTEVDNSFSISRKHTKVDIENYIK